MNGVSTFNDRILLDEEGSLVITNAEGGEDTGEYVCMAKNEYGQDTISASVAVRTIQIPTPDAEINKSTWLKTLCTILEFNLFVILILGICRLCYMCFRKKIQNCTSA